MTTTLASAKPLSPADAAALRSALAAYPWPEGIGMREIKIDAVCRIDRVEDPATLPEAVGLLRRVLAKEADGGGKVKVAGGRRARASLTCRPSSP